MLIRRNTPEAQGFSLVELMVVVIIIAVLAAIAFPLYARQRYKAQATEASETLTRIVQAQESYRSEFNAYSDVAHDPSLAGTNEGTNGTLGSNWHPALGAPAAGPGGRTDFYANLPAAWNQLGVRPRRQVRYSYQTSAGNPGVVPVTPDGDMGYSALLNQQQNAWYYAVASGDLDRDGVYSQFSTSNLLNRVIVVRETE
ncbi:MAG: prepilin-type N-terminal cleavage/methylation domain-containing protein [Myxococcales bacterium]|nr:prepilin-type N-terminal cleavage/methylation domain-containing protein [Myxococcales bacterium]